MATAKAIKLREEVILTMTKEEAQLLAALLGKCNGVNSTRPMYCAVKQALKFMGISPAILNSLPTIDLHRNITKYP